jgi:succinoglycan biosynthesis transport protein ExoP
MELLPGGPPDEQNEIVSYHENPVFLESARNSYSAQNGDQDDSNGHVRVGMLARKYWLLITFFLILGAAAGFASVVLSSPSYQARLLLEVQSTSSALMRNNGGGADSGDASEVGIATQVSILRSNSFRQRGAERMSQDAVPLAPTGRDIFSRLRQRVHPAIQDPIENQKQGLSSAVYSFDAKPVTRTRLIELTCESSSPDIAAQYLNAMASEFVDDSTRSRMKTAQATSEWLAQSIEDTKSKMQEADERVRDFVAASGNIFAGQDATLEDTKLSSLKLDLAKAQADAITKRTRYELTLKNPPEALGEVLDDGVLRGYQQKIGVLKEQEAALEVRYTPKHQKVREVAAQLASVEKDYQNEIHSVVSRIKNDYEAAARQQKLLTDTYNSQSQRVGAQAAKASQYTALRREAETLHQVYQSLLMQQSEAGLNSSVPVNGIRIVEPASPPEKPYKPRPVLNISFGCLLGAVLAVGLAFLRERSDHSIRAPGASRKLFNVPELGVIPNLHNGYATAALRAMGGSKTLTLNGHGDDSAALVNWQAGPSFITESFRGTLTSILRNQTNGKAQKTILITSPGPSEGKTTVIQNLGIALAETGRRVLLVDADFRRPHLHHKFGMPNDWGMMNLLTEDMPLSEYEPERLGVATGVPGLSLLANGPTAEQASVSRALYSPRLREIFKRLTREYDMVLVDAPPILHVADARIVAPLVDALILVLRSGVTDRASAMEAYQRIQEDGLTLLGTVLTDYDLGADRKRQYYYDYGDTSRA